MQSSVENANIPAFLGKLWKMVDDPATNRLICWGSSGKSFIIQNQAQFWYELLPLYYKHNNMSSFVRQLNMYGFHKISTIENGSMDADKDEIQFYHPYFQKDHPEKLVHIKRKVNNSKGQDNQSSLKHDELTKVLTDIRQLRGRQSSVDAQLNAMKQENDVLWRELALLRQKHMKQQQIVNKLIQFLVTLVQPATPNRMGVGVKRKLPLMLHENKKGRPKKNPRPSEDAGPTIFELDNEVELSPNELLQESLEEDIPLVNSPAPTSASSDSSSKLRSSPASEQSVQNVVANQEDLNTTVLWEKPEFVDIDAIPCSEENMISTDTEQTGATTEKVFINPNNRDTLISNLINTGSYNTNITIQKNSMNGKKQKTNKQNNTNNSERAMQVATKNDQTRLDSNAGNSNAVREDLDQHIDTAQSELDQLKDILSGCNTLDANALLGLFAENDPDFGIRASLQNKGNSTSESSDPLVSGTELTPASNLIDFNDLFVESLHTEEDSLDTETDLMDSTVAIPLPNEPLNTPLMVKNEPIFPKGK